MRKAFAFFLICTLIAAPFLSQTSDIYALGIKDPNFAPVFADVPELIISNGKLVDEINIYSYVSDPESEYVYLAFMEDPVNISLYNDEGIIKLDYVNEGWYGSEIVNIQAQDASGLISTKGLKVTSVNDENVLPSPTEIELGCVRLYKETFYRGQYKDICEGEYTHDDLENFNGNIGSLFIANGYEVTFFAGNNFENPIKTAYSTQTNLNTSVDGCSSIMQCTHSLKINLATEDQNIITKKLLLITFNPFLPSKNQSLIEYGKTINWQDPNELNTKLLKWFEDSEKLKFTVTESIEYNDFVPKNDGFKYDETTYLNCLANAPTGCYGKDKANYSWLIEEFNICEKVNAGDIDGVWLQGGPYFGFAESLLVGPNPYRYNGPPMHNLTCNKNIPIMGFNYERTTAEMKHDFMHSFESMMKQYYKGWSIQTISNTWERFSIVDSLAPDYNFSGCGNAHYSANTINEYVHDTTNFVNSYCDEFLKYPLQNYNNLQSINCTEWNCTGEGYYDYWFNHLPNKNGQSVSGFQNNWWMYLADPNLILEIPRVKAQENLSKGKSILTAQGNYVNSHATDGNLVFEGMNLGAGNSIALDKYKNHFIIDLENRYDLNEIKIQGGFNEEQNIQVEFSKDNYHWSNKTKFYSVEGLGTTAKTLKVDTSSTARFIKISLIDDDHRYSISEIEVKGTVSPTPNTPPTVNVGLDATIAPNTFVTLEAQVSDLENDTLEYIWSADSTNPDVHIISPNSKTTQVEIPNLENDTNIKFTLNVYDSNNLVQKDDLNILVKGSYNYGIVRIETSPINPSVSKNLTSLFDNQTSSDEGVSHKGKELALIMEFDQAKEYAYFKAAFGEKWDVYAAQSWEDMMNNTNVSKIGDSITTPAGDMQKINFKNTTAKVYKLVSKSENETVHNITELQEGSPNTPPIITSIPALTTNEDTLGNRISLHNYVQDNENDLISWQIIKDTDQNNLKVDINSNNEMGLNWLKENWNGTDTITLKASDIHGDSNEINLDIVVNVINDKPTIDNISLQQVYINKNYQYQSIAKDVDNTNLNYSLTTAPQGMSVSSTGLISWKPTNAQRGIKNVTLQVTDGTLSANTSFQIKAIYPSKLEENFDTLNDFKVSTVTGYSVSAADGKLYALTTNNSNERATLTSGWIEPETAKIYTLKTNARGVNADKPQISIDLYDQSQTKIGTLVTLNGVNGTSNWTEYTKDVNIPAVFANKDVKYAKIIVSVGDKYDGLSTASAKTYINYVYLNLK